MLYGIGKILFMIYFRLFFRIKTTGRENIPSSGLSTLCEPKLHALDSSYRCEGAKEKGSLYGKGRAL